MNKSTLPNNINTEVKPLKIAQSPSSINIENKNMKSTNAKTITRDKISYTIPEEVLKQRNRHKRQSKDITYAECVNFDGTSLPINNSEEYGAYRKILKTIHTQLSNMLTHYCKVFTLRFDLHFNPNDFDEAMITAIFAKIKNEYKKTGNVMHIWAREIDKATTPHYHCVIGFNGNKIQNPMRAFNSIVTIWSDEMQQPRPHLCEDGNHMLTCTHDRIFIDAFMRFSYLAKIRTKDRQPPNKRNYGASQLKPAIRIKKTG
jgi:hypothetical protein